MFLREIKRVLIHIRPKLQNFTLLGFIFGCLVAGVPFSFTLLLAFMSWFLLCAGVTVFNSYYDKDKDPVAGLKKPPKTSESMFYGSILLKVIGLIIAAFINNIFLLLYILIIILSFLYSHSLFRLKSKGFVAVIFNFIMGFVTLIVAASLGKMSMISLIAGIGAGLFSASFYIMMQIHQKKEDMKRGDISLAIMLGKKMALRISFLLFVIAGIFIIISLIRININIFFIILVILYFLAILSCLEWWIETNSKNIIDYEVMSKITEYSGYIGNIFLLLIYLIKVVF